VPPASGSPATLSAASEAAIVVMADVDVLDNNFIYVWLTTSAGRGLFTNVLATEVYIKAFIDGHWGYSPVTYAATQELSPV
jgi:hypothetical protein